MQVSFHNREDGTTVLRITRSDGSVTWQKQQGAHARFFPLHDLTHYAVETTLGTRSAFYGLIASGWDIPDTDGLLAIRVKIAELHREWLEHSSRHEPMVLEFNVTDGD